MFIIIIKTSEYLDKFVKSKIKLNKIRSLIFSEYLLILLYHI